MIPRIIYGHMLLKRCTVFPTGTYGVHDSPIPGKKKEVADVRFFPSPSDEKENGYTVHSIIVHGAEYLTSDQQSAFFSIGFS